jgi:hypothetical protein
VGGEVRVRGEYRFFEFARVGDKEDKGSIGLALL